LDARFIFVSSQCHGRSSLTSGFDDIFQQLAAGQNMVEVITGAFLLIGLLAIVLSAMSALLSSSLCALRYDVVPLLIAEPPSTGSPVNQIECRIDRPCGAPLASNHLRLRCSVASPSCTGKLPDRSSGSAPALFSRHRRGLGTSDEGASFRFLSSPVTSPWTILILSSSLLLQGNSRNGQKQSAANAITSEREAMIWLPSRVFDRLESHDAELRHRPRLV
jgi:hypothetical protein